MLVEQADERPDRARCIVIFGLAEKQCAAPFEVPQVDVVAERRTADVAPAALDQHDFGFGVVPAGIRPDADFRAPADAGERGWLAEYYGIVSIRDFDILRP